MAAEAGGTYQLLFSEDLRSWSPDFVRRHLFNEFGFLSWLSPQIGTGNAPLVWQTKSLNRQAYFAAWQYDFGPPFDEDGDQLPDYWEKRHFTDLSATPDGDTNGDGLTHLDEARLFVSPIAFDSDDDGLSDAEEVAYVPPLNPAARDTDGDTLTDGDELSVYHSDPHLADTDSDGLTDGFEVSVGSSPIKDEPAPVLDNVLPTFAEDLMVHFDFESSDQAGVLNRGQLGGHGRIVGQESYVTRESEKGEASRAIDLVSDPNDSLNVNHVETEFSLGDLGLSADGSEITVSLWRRTETGQRTTFLSAARNKDSAEAISFQIGSARQDRMLPLTVALRAPSWSSNAITQNTMQVGTWTHVFWTHGPGGQKVYINGNLNAQSSIGWTYLVPFGGKTLPLGSDSKLRLGAVQPSQPVPLPFRGTMDDVRIYRRVLPEGAIKRLAR